MCANGWNPVPELHLNILLFTLMKVKPVCIITLLKLCWVGTHVWVQGSCVNGWNPAPWSIHQQQSCECIIQFRKCSS